MKSPKVLDQSTSRCTGSDRRQRSHTARHGIQTHNLSNPAQQCAAANSSATPCQQRKTQATRRAHGSLCTPLTHVWNSSAKMIQIPHCLTASIGDVITHSVSTARSVLYVCSLCGLAGRNQGRPSSEPSRRKTDPAVWALKNTYKNDDTM